MPLVRPREGVTLENTRNCGTGRCPAGSRSRGRFHPTGEHRPARASRSLHHPPPLAGDRRLARAHALRRLRGRAALDALVPEPRRSRASRPTRRASGRSRRSAPAPARRTSSSSTPERRRHEEPGDRAGDGARRRQRPGARTSSYFSTGNLMYVSRDRHTTFCRSTRPAAPARRRRAAPRRCAPRRQPAFRPGSPST